MSMEIVCSRFPEDLHGISPYMVGEMRGIRVLLIDQDIDGYKRISEEEAAKLIGEQAIIEARAAV